MTVTSIKRTLVTLLISILMLPVGHASVVGPPGKHNIPGDAKLFLLVLKHDYIMYVYSFGKRIGEYEIALSQEPVGHKQKEGDLKLPEGEYRICQKSRGPFGTEPFWKRYLGPRWIRIDYPNRDDAERGLQDGIISKRDHERIQSAIDNHQTPPQHTALGGGIGIHGWTKEDWDNDGDRNLTWGCISMHNKDLTEFYELVEIGTAIRIVP